MIQPPIHSPSHSSHEIPLFPIPISFPDLLLLLQLSKPSRLIPSRPMWELMHELAITFDAAALIALVPALLGRLGLDCWILLILKDIRSQDRLIKIKSVVRRGGAVRKLMVKSKIISHTHTDIQLVPTLSI